MANEKKNVHRYFVMKKAFWIVLAMLCVSIAVNHWQYSHQPKTETKIEHDTVWRDTIIEKPVAVDSHMTGRVVYIKVPATHRGQSPYAVDSLPHTGDSPHVSDDSIKVAVPIMQKRYEDSMYTAWVSGYQPQLDSIALHQPEIVTTIERTIIKPAPRWSIGPSVGAGVSITGEQQAGIYLGFTVQYRLWPK